MIASRANALACELLKGNQRSLARLITLIENQEKNVHIALAAIYEHTGKAQILGVTGPPGAGKSTLVDKLINYARKDGKKVGVLCIDPSSPFTGGAILGDRIRMQRHAADSKVFIRSLGTRNCQGGLSRSTQEVTMLLDAAGYDLIILETAGVGQTELGIISIAQTTLVILVPESGDDIQMMKAGILEIADILVVNKCDRTGSDHIVRELKSMLELNTINKQENWKFPIIKTVAENDSGVQEVYSKISNHYYYLKKSGKLISKRTAFIKKAILNIICDQAATLAAKYLTKDSGKKLLSAVANGKIDPFGAAQKIRI